MNILYTGCLKIDATHLYMQPILYMQPMIHYWDKSTDSWNSSHKKCILLDRDIKSMLFFY